MMASLEQRISRMEIALDVANPYAHWTDEELEEAIRILSAKALPGVRRAMTENARDEAEGSEDAATLRPRLERLERHLRGNLTVPSSADDLPGRELEDVLAIIDERWPEKAEAI